MKDPADNRTMDFGALLLTKLGRSPAPPLPGDELCALLRKKGGGWEDEPRVPAGSTEGGEWTSGGGGGKGKAGGKAKAKGKKLSARAERAKATYKPSTKAVQDVARQAEEKIARMTGGIITDDEVQNNHPFDVLVTDSKGRLHGIEVKSLQNNKNGKITMHPPSRRRKEEWAKKHKIITHTIGVETRTNAEVPAGTVYYRSGLGAYRLYTMGTTRTVKGLRLGLGL